MKRETVTFLFTDIEGSTALLSRLGDVAYAAVLEDHHQIIRSNLQAFGGLEQGTEGDAFFAVFSTPSACVNAALQMQRELHAHNWSSDFEVRVRMGIHTGEASEAPTGMVGYEVHRAARIAAVGYGGQVLVSSSTMTLVQESLPAGAWLLDLGSHRLKDLRRPEFIFQLVAEGLDVEFPPLRSLDNPELDNNLPIQLTSFVGRQREIAEVAALVQESRLVTLTGPGGAGKTRLALQVAAELLDGSGDGVWFVDLAPLSNPDLVPAALAFAVGLRDQPGRPILETLIDALRSRRLLIVLDNCEHLIDGCARLLDQLLRTCLAVRVLATSREVLGVAGEHRYLVPPLDLPTDDAWADSPSGAVLLFAERAQDHSHFVLDESTFPIVVELCRRLDGMPLAIELACARLRSMSLKDIKDRLDQRFRLLTGGSRAALPRQQTLRSLIDWSYDLLSVPEQVVFERLSAFAGSFDLTAAEIVGSTDEVDSFDVAEVVGLLIDKSLVMAEGEAVGVRYRLLETIRQYAAERLAAGGETAAITVGLAHARHYLALAEEAAPHLRGHGQAEWLDRLDVEHDNLRVALHELLQGTHDDEALRLTVALADFWRIRHISECIDSLHVVLKSTREDAHLELRANALAVLARTIRGQPHEALSFVEEGLAITSKGSFPALRTELLLASAWPIFETGNVVQLDAITREALELAHATDSAQFIGRAHERRGFVTIVAVDSKADECRAELLDAIEWLRRAGDRAEEGRALGNLANLEVYEGNYDAARRAGTRCS